MKLVKLVKLSWFSLTEAAAQLRIYGSCMHNIVSL